MPLIRLTVTRKIAAGFLLLVAFCLAAIIFALMALDNLRVRSEELVRRDFRALVLTRELSSSLADLERLEKQVLILRDPSMFPLIDRRDEDNNLLHRQLAELLPDGRLAEVERLFSTVATARIQNRALLEELNWEEADRHSQRVMTPLNDQLFSALQRFRSAQEAFLDQTMQTFNSASVRAYRLTLTLAFAGIGLAALVAGGIILKIHRAMARLTQATRAMAEGRFEHPVGLEGQDEFGMLARSFSEMGMKLRELQSLNLDANPLTRLPGNLVIERELEQRIAGDQPFAHIYIDLDYFKAYNDRYGYQAGSDVISKVGTMIQQVTERLGNPADLIGHVGGDDYVILSTPDRAEALCEAVIREFDAMVPDFYSEQDRKAGCFEGQDRYGVVRRFPLLSMSIAVVGTQNLRNPSAEAIGRECAKMKEHLKLLPGSNYLLDRRERR